MVFVLGSDAGDDDGDGGSAAIALEQDHIAPLQMHWTIFCFFEAYCCQHQTSMLNAVEQ